MNFIKMYVTLFENVRQFNKNLHVIPKIYFVSFKENVCYIYNYVHVFQKYVCDIIENLQYVKMLV